MTTPTETTARPAPARAPARPRVAPPPPGPPPAAPGWGERLLPRPLRTAMADLGWWTNPTPQPPSRHLLQVRDTLTRYGWAQTANLSPTGRMCIQGAQHLLERTGHVTPEARWRAVTHLETVLRTAGIHLSFPTWNDLPDNTLHTVTHVLEHAAAHAARNGD